MLKIYLLFIPELLGISLFCFFFSPIFLSSNSFFPAHYAQYFAPSYLLCSRFCSKFSYLTVTACTISYRCFYINCADRLTVQLYIDLLYSVAKHNEYLGEATSYCCITSIWSNYIRIIISPTCELNVFCSNLLLLCQHFALCFSIPIMPKFMLAKSTYPYELPKNLPTLFPNHNL